MVAQAITAEDDLQDNLADHRLSSSIARTIALMSGLVQDAGEQARAEGASRASR
jgi:hypothetical protein